MYENVFINIFSNINKILALAEKYSLSQEVWRYVWENYFNLKMKRTFLMF